MQEVSCEDLRQINQLWLDYSNGKFGFSVQKDIWRECGGRSDDAHKWVTSENASSYRKFADRVGWYRKDVGIKDGWLSSPQLQYELSSTTPTGHLPRLACTVGDSVDDWEAWSWFFSRVTHCNL